MKVKMNENFYNDETELYPDDSDYMGDYNKSIQRTTNRPSLRDLDQDKNYKNKNTSKVKKPRTKTSEKKRQLLWDEYVSNFKNTWKYDGNVYYDNEDGILEYEDDDTMTYFDAQWIPWSDNVWGHYQKGTDYIEYRFDSQWDFFNSKEVYGGFYWLTNHD